MATYDPFMTQLNGHSGICTCAVRRWDSYFTDLNESTTGLSEVTYTTFSTQLPQAGRAWYTLGSCRETRSQASVPNLQACLQLHAPDVTVLSKSS